MVFPVKPEKPIRSVTWAIIERKSMLELTKTELSRPYEAVVILGVDTPEGEQKDLFKKNKNIIESFSGEMNHIDTWGERKLANPINKQKKAIYFHYTFTALPHAINEMERTMKLDDRVLRVIHSRLSEKIPLQKQVENFKDRIAESIQKKKEKEGKFKSRKTFRQ